MEETFETVADFFSAPGAPMQVENLFGGSHYISGEVEDTKYGPEITLTLTFLRGSE